MRVCIIGTGYVGLVTGACFAELGHAVVCVDSDSAKIAELNRGIVPIHEPGLADLIARNRKAGRLSFTASLDEAAAGGASAYFLAVGTPTRPEDGGADLAHVFLAAGQLAQALSAQTAASGFATVVTKSTVPVGTNREIERILAAHLEQNRFGLASNPEFLREGNAIADFMAPDRIVIGTRSPRAREVLEELYKPLTDAGRRMLATDSIETAELMKYAANTFLATKISFINEIARLCEKIGANVEEIAEGIGLDSRIGRHFLKAGPGFGGSCFPKDTLALIKTANDLGSPVEIAKAVVDANNSHMHFVCNKIRAALGGSVKGKKLAILGLTFKAGTDDIRNAASLRVIPVMYAEGAIVAAYDPIANPKAQRALGAGSARFAESLEDAVRSADAAVVLTEWKEFREADWGRLKQGMAAPLLVDFRNIFSRREARDLGLTYISLGRNPVLSGKPK